ncbi:MAG: PA14 domain-containing protein [Actinomycetota bacterium]
MARVAATSVSRPSKDYQYYPNGQLQYVRDVLNNDLIAYGTITDPSSTTHMTALTYDQLGRASSVTAPAPDTGASPAPEHSYDYKSVTQTMVGVANGAVPIYATTTVDAASGNVTAHTDQLGDSTSYSWNGSLLTSTIDPTHLETTTIYNAENEATDSYGPAPASTFTGLVSTSAPHPMTYYDQGMAGLAASFFDNATLSPSAPTQTVHATGVGDPTGALDANWGTTPPAGVTTTGWSARFTGYVTASVTGSYSFSVTGTGTTALYVNNAPYAGPVNLSAGVPVAIRLDYTAPGAGGASLGLDWTPSGGSTTLVPGINLDPGYGLATTTTDADAKTTATQYSESGVDPAEGLATAQIVDPGGLNLTTTTIYEPKGTGYFRPTNTILPKGAATAVTNTYIHPCRPLRPTTARRGASPRRACWRRRRGRGRARSSTTTSTTPPGG